MTQMRRRQFLVGTGVVFAHTTIAGRASRAASAAPPAPPTPPIAPPAQPAPIGINPKPGVAPGYIVSGRGENLSNPYFHPLGAPSNKRTPAPPATHGKGVNEDDQGENQQ